MKNLSKILTIAILAMIVSLTSCTKTENPIQTETHLNETTSKEQIKLLEQSLNYISYSGYTTEKKVRFQLQNYS